MVRYPPMAGVGKVRSLAARLKVSFPARRPPPKADFPNLTIVARAALLDGAHRPLPLILP